MKITILVGVIAVVLGVGAFFQLSTESRAPNITSPENRESQKPGQQTQLSTATHANDEEEGVRLPLKTRSSIRQEPIDSSQKLEQRVKNLKIAVEKEQKNLDERRGAVAAIINEKKLTYPSASEDPEVTSAMKDVELAVSKCEALRLELFQSNIQLKTVRNEVSTEEQSKSAEQAGGGQPATRPESK
jgi:hypothetical protein